MAGEQPTLGEEGISYPQFLRQGLPQAGFTDARVGQIYGELVPEEERIGGIITPDGFTEEFDATRQQTEEDASATPYRGSEPE